jgi:hypothetical protein
VTVKIAPSKEQVRIWIENFVPKIDLFFVEEKDLIMFAEYLSEVLVVPREEFFGHPSYKQIQLINSYTYWKISDKAKFVIVAQPGWITNLPKQKKRDILITQYKMGRGLIFPLSFFPISANSFAQEYIVEEKGEKFFIIQHNIWNELPYKFKEGAIQSYSQLWDSWDCCDVPEQTPIHIKKYANKFSIESGSNCLSSTLFAVTEQEWIIGEWIHPKTFLNGLERANFSIINDEIKKGDVITWVNNEEVVQHATYHIDNNLFFNKDGQTFFNPWKVTHLNEINEEWGKYTTKIYRKR